MLIINSDDFGASEYINHSTYLAFCENLISSTTALVNFEESLRDAVSYVKSGKIKAEAIGIHLNLTAGSPLTQKMKDNENFCENGEFKPNRNRNIFFLSRYDKACVLEELEAQILYFKSSFGFMPSHIDSHQHIHTEWAIIQCVAHLAKKHSIDSIRLSQNLGKTTSLAKRIYKVLFNRYLKLRKFKITDKFGGVSSLCHSNFDRNTNYEIMVHVTVDKKGGPIKDNNDIDLKKKLQEIFQSKHWQLNNYTDFARNHHM